MSGDRRRIIRETFFVLVLFGLARTAHAGAGRGEDAFLICERPARLVVLNRYQQTLTSDETRLLQPFVPMKILTARELLGDGFTPCTRVELDGRVFFLVRDNANRFAGAALAGELRSYTGTSHSQDTVHVLKGGLLLFSAAGGGGEDRLRPGEKIVRIFSYGNQTYISRSAGTRRFGWVTLSPGAEGRLWTLVRLPSTSSTTIPSRIMDSIRASLSKTNILLTDLFAHFNSQSGQHRTPPQWQMEPDGEQLRCMLLNGSPDRDFPESTRYLLREIENHLLGTGFAARPYPGGIEIGPK